MSHISFLDIAGMRILPTLRPYGPTDCVFHIVETTAGGHTHTHSYPRRVCAELVQLRLRKPGLALELILRVALLPTWFAEGLS